MKDNNVLAQPWSNAACLGYAVAAMENLDCGYERICQTAAEMKELFDWLSPGEAEEYYRGSDY